MRQIYTDDAVDRKVYMKICGIYAILSVTWIVFSDKVTPLFAETIHDMVFLNIAKGCAFVLITTILLYLLMNFFLGKIMVANQSLRKVNTMLKNREDELLVNFQLLNEKTKALKSSEQKFRSLFDHMVTGFSTYKTSINMEDSENVFHLIDANPAFKQIMGIDSLFGLLEIGDFSDRMAWKIPLNKVIQTGSPEPFILWDNRHKKYFKGVVYKTELGNIAIQCYDATEQVKIEQKNEYMAYHDILTNLPNRHFYKEQLNAALSMRDKFAIVLMDLDNFKDINDTLGHNVGDQLLIDFSDRLVDAVLKPNIAARWGGDEFILLIKNKADIENIQNFMENLYKQITEPWQYGATMYRISCKMGVTVYPYNSKNGDVLIKQADMAMYKMKGNSNKFICFYDHEIEEEVKQRAIFENELYMAIKENHFVMYYQPQIDIHGRFCGVEALIRWVHKHKGMVSPDKFISLAEKNGLILPMGAWVFKDVCRQIKKWNECAITADMNVSINISPKQFLRENLVERMKTAIAENNIDPKQITIEITETTAIENADKTIDILNQLKALGIKIALDDFGTGYSSLIYLKKFPFDTIKIDKSFIQDITIKAEAKELVQTIISLAKNLNYKVVAEGVESIEEVELLGRVD